MAEIRVPLDQTSHITHELQRMAADLADIRATIHRIMAAGAGAAGGDSSPVAIAEEVTRAVGPLIETAHGLAQALRAATTLLSDLDQQGAASFPEVPRISFSLPILIPPALPWPYAATPPMTMIPRSTAQDPTSSPPDSPPSAFRP